MLEAALAAARRAGLKQVRTQAEMGQAAPEIAHAAGELGVDPVLTGTQGRNALGGQLLGSLAQRVVHLAKMLVLLVKQEGVPELRSPRRARRVRAARLAPGHLAIGPPETP